MRKEHADHELETVGAHLRDMTPWLQPRTQCD